MLKRAVKSEQIVHLFKLWFSFVLGLVYEFWFYYDKVWKFNLWQVEIKEIIITPYVENFFILNILIFFENWCYSQVHQFGLKPFFEGVGKYFFETHPQTVSVYQSVSWSLCLSVCHCLVSLYVPRDLLSRNRKPIARKVFLKMHFLFFCRPISLSVMVSTVSPTPFI